MPFSHFNFRGVNFYYNEAADSTEFRYDCGIGNSVLTVTYRVAWTQRFLARAALLGTTEYRTFPGMVFPGTTFGYLHRILPHAQAESALNGNQLNSNPAFSQPGGSWVWCNRADYIGRVRRTVLDDGLPGNLYAMFHCTYTGLPYQSMTDGQMQGGGESAGEPAIIPVDEGQLRRFVSHPCPEDKSFLKKDEGGRWKFTDTGRIYTDALYTPQAVESHVLTWHQVPKANIPRISIRGCKFCTNAQPFAGFDTETIVFMKHAIKDLPRLQDGTMGVDLLYYFDYHPYGANLFPDRNRLPNFYYTVEDAAGTGRKPFPVANFRYLFRPEPAVAGAVM